MISVAVQCYWSNTNYMPSFLIQHHWKKRQNCLREYKKYIYIYGYRNPKRGCNDGRIILNNNNTQKWAINVLLLASKMFSFVSLMQVIRTSILPMSFFTFWTVPLIASLSKKSHSWVNIIDPDRDNESSFDLLCLGSTIKCRCFNLVTVSSIVFESLSTQITEHPFFKNSLAKDSPNEEETPAIWKKKKRKEEIKHKI